MLKIVIVFTKYLFQRRGLLKRIQDIGGDVPRCLQNGTIRLMRGHGDVWVVNWQPKSNTNSISKQQQGRVFLIPR